MDWSGTSLKSTLLRKFSDVPHSTDALVKFLDIHQKEDETCSSYIIRAQDLLSRAHNTNNFTLISALTFHLPLVKGFLKDG